MARGSSASLVIESDTLTPSIKAAPEVVDNYVAQIMSYFAPRVESYARSNASWRDRTGNARSGLHASASHLGSSHAIELSHSVPYGIWLEVRWSGRYAIINPTIENQGRELMATFRNLMSKL